MTVAKKDNTWNLRAKDCPGVSALMKYTLAIMVSRTTSRTCAASSRRSPKKRPHKCPAKSPCYNCTEKKLDHLAKPSEIIHLGCWFEHKTMLTRSIFPNRRRNLLLIQRNWRTALLRKQRKPKKGREEKESSEKEDCNQIARKLQRKQRNRRQRKQRKNLRQNQPLRSTESLKQRRKERNRFTTTSKTTILIARHLKKYIYLGSIGRSLLESDQQSIGTFAFQIVHFPISFYNFPPPFPPELRISEIALLRMWNVQIARSKKFSKLIRNSV